MNYRKNKFLKESFFNLYVSKLFRLNWLIVFCIFLLCLIGVTSLYSAAGGQWNPWAKSHLYRSLIGISVMLFIALLPPNFYNKLSFYCFILGLLSLLFVKFFGHGSVQRWISIGGFNFQPS